MKRIILQEGDKLRSLVDIPFDISMPRNSICEIVGFGRQNSPWEPKKFDGCAPHVMFTGQKWFTDVRTLFHNFKKETR
jgi:hypothetical protein